MPAATDFIGQVYDSIAKALNINSNTPNLVMQMAWPGFALSPADFKPASAPNGPYDPNVALDQFSSIVDMVPAMNKLQFQNSGFEVSDLYEILLMSAIPIGASPDNVQANPIYKLFSDALYDFGATKRARMDDPNVFYNPAVATPVNWYDEAASASWPIIDINNSSGPSAVNPDSIFTRLGGAAIVTRELFKLRPKTDTPIGVKPLVPTGVKTMRMSSAFVLPRAGTMMKPAAAPAPQPVKTVRMMPINPVLTNKAAFAKTAGQSRASTLFRPAAPPTNKIVEPTPALNLSSVMLNRNMQIQSAPKKLALGDNILVKNLAFRQLDTKAPQGSSSGFRIRFRYCSVNIDRPWLNLSLLSMKNWYMYGVPQADYSTGNADNNPGMFPLLPVSFIVVRDLQITANWSAEDKSTLGESVAFGPFDVRVGTWNQNTLTIPGMQIICWVSKVMPALPPAVMPG